MSRLLVLAGGSPHAHDFDSSGAAVADVISALGHDVEIRNHPDAAAARLDAACEGSAAPIDAFVLLGLWWRMTGDAYEAWRDDYAYITPAATRQAFTSFVGGGGGLMAMHTAPICFDDWPEWADVVGGGWRWGVSSHPPFGRVNARIVAADHPVVKGVPRILELDDEVYGDLDISDGVEVLAVARRHETDDEQPVMWAHRFNAGRVVFDGFGHDVASIRQPAHSRIIEQAVTWILRSERA
jgi:uncharacterized protein